MGKMYSSGQIASMLGISQSTILKYVKQGIIVPDMIMPSTSNRKGKQLFSEETVEKFKKSLVNTNKEGN